MKRKFVGVMLVLAFCFGSLQGGVALASGPIYSTFGKNAGGKPDINLDFWYLNNSFKYRLLDIHFENLLNPFTAQNSMFCNQNLLPGGEGSEKTVVEYFLTFLYHLMVSFEKIDGSKQAEINIRTLERLAGYIENSIPNSNTTGKELIFSIFCDENVCEDFRDLHYRVFEFPKKMFYLSPTNYNYLVDDGEVALLLLWPITIGDIKVYGGFVIDLHEDLVFRLAFYKGDDCCGSYELYPIVCRESFDEDY